MRDSLILTRLASFLDTPPSSPTWGPRVWGPRVLALVAACIALIGCDPVISGETYFCGPNALCPPDLQCQHGASFPTDPASTIGALPYNCVVPEVAQEFSCNEVTADQEPDDELASASDLGDLGCGREISFQGWGCLEESDVDHFRFTKTAVCTGGDPRVLSTVRFPIGAAPLRLELLNAVGALVAVGETCGVQDNSGTERVCLVLREAPPEDYTLRVVRDESRSDDCNGKCRFNRYQLVIASPTS